MVSVPLDSRPGMTKVVLVGRPFWPAEKGQADMAITVKRLSIAVASLALAGGTIGFGAASAEAASVHRQAVTAHDGGGGGRHHHHHHKGGGCSGGGGGTTTTTSTSTTSTSTTTTTSPTRS